MTPNKNTTKRAASAVVALSLCFLSLLALAQPTSAHACGGDHSACASHDCPDDGDSHDHTHEIRWWPDHGCWSRPTSSECNVEALRVQSTYGADALVVCDALGGGSWSLPNPTGSSDTQSADADPAYAILGETLTFGA